MSFRGDDQAAFQAFEAILVAILIGSATLFVVATSNPVLETTGAGIDLSPEAQEAVIQMTTTFKVDFFEALNTSLVGSGASNDWDTLIGKVLDDDFRYAVQLNNGVDTFQIHPEPGKTLVSPRGAVQGTAYLRADWIGADLGRPTYTVGAELDFTMTDPNLLYHQFYDGTNMTAESKTGPGGQPWLEIWDSLANNPGEVPQGMPLGKWRYGGTEFELTPLDASVTGHVEFPTVAVQLLIWDGAA